MISLSMVSIKLFIIFVLYCICFLAVFVKGMEFNDVWIQLFSIVMLILFLMVLRV